MFLPKVVGLTNGKLFYCLLILALLSSYWHGNLLFRIEMGIWIFLGRLSILLLGKKAANKYPYAGHIDLHPGFLIVTGPFCGMSLLLSHPMRPSWQKSWLQLSLFLNTKPKAEALQTLVAKPFSPLFRFHLKAKQKNNLPFSGSRSPCQEFVLCNKLHLLSDHNWLISSSFMGAK